MALKKTIIEVIRMFESSLAIVSDNLILHKNIEANIDIWYQYLKDYMYLEEHGIVIPECSYWRDAINMLIERCEKHRYNLA